MLMRTTWQSRYGCDAASAFTLSIQVLASSDLWLPHDSSCLSCIVAATWLKAVSCTSRCLNSNCTPSLGESARHMHHCSESIMSCLKWCLQQTDINAKMRAILIDWLVEVHQKFKLLPDTLFLTINIIDRFLQKKAVTRKNLQLVRLTQRMPLETSCLLQSHK